MICPSITSSKHKHTKAHNYDTLPHRNHSQDGEQPFDSASVSAAASELSASIEINSRDTQTSSNNRKRRFSEHADVIAAEKNSPSTQKKKLSHDEKNISNGSAAIPLSEARHQVKDLSTRRGRVVHAVADSFEGLDKTARLVDAKGVFFNRGRHQKEDAITRWLREHEEDDFLFGEVAHGQLLVAAPLNECDDSDCEDTVCKEELSKIPRPGLKEIQNVCEQLVAELPPSFRDAVRRDAEELGLTMMRLCPNVPWLTWRLEIVQRHACWRWHQDGYTGRVIISYVGPGTCTTDDNCVRWEEFAKTANDETNESCVPREHIKQMQTNSVLLMKGDAWPGIRGTGLTHKSPDVRADTNPPPKRLLLKVDLNKFRPPLDSESEDEDEDEGEEGPDEEDEMDMVMVG